MIKNPRDETDIDRYRKSQQTTNPGVDAKLPHSIMSTFRKMIDDGHIENIEFEVKPRK